MQFFRGVTAVLGATALLAGACSTELTQSPFGQVRLDQPENAVKAIVLGTASEPSAGIDVPGLTMNRRTTSLCLVATAAQRMFVVDPGREILEQLDAVYLPPELQRPADALPVDGVILSCADPHAIAGLPLLAGRVGEHAAIPVWCASLVRPPLERSGACAADVAAGRLTLVDLPTGVAVPLCDSLTVTARSVWSANALTLQFDGARRALLYAPRLGRVLDLAPPLRTQLASVAVALLDGGRDRAASEDPVDATLRVIDPPLPGPPRTVLFLRLTPGDPLLDAALPERDRLRRRGADVAEDGSEFWL